MSAEAASALQRRRRREDGAAAAREEEEAAVHAVNGRAHAPLALARRRLGLWAATGARCVACCRRQGVEVEAELPGGGRPRRGWVAVPRGEPGEDLAAAAGRLADSAVGARFPAYAWPIAVLVAALHAAALAPGPLPQPLAFAKQLGLDVFGSVTNLRWLCAATHLIHAAEAWAVYARARGAFGLPRPAARTYALLAACVGGPAFGVLGELRQ